MLVILLGVRVQSLENARVPARGATVREREPPEPSDQHQGRSIRTSKAFGTRLENARVRARDAAVREGEPPGPGDQHQGRGISASKASGTRKGSASARRLAPGGGSHQEVLIRIWKRCQIGNMVTGCVTLCDSYPSHSYCDFEVIIFGKRWKWHDYRPQIHLNYIFAATSKYQSSDNACKTRRPQTHFERLRSTNLRKTLARLVDLKTLLPDTLFCTFNLFSMATSSISSKAELNCPTVPSVSALTGHYRGGQNLFSVCEGWRSVVLDTPNPQEAPCSEPLERNPDFRKPTYMTPRMPYHVFIPKYNPWHGPLLGALDYTFESLPIAQFGDSWSLDRDVVQEWRDFEDCLRSVGRELPWFSSKPFPQRIEPWFIAGRYHYSLYYRTEKEARSAAWRCRKKFLPLLGYASMGLWFMAHEEGDEAEEALGITSGSKRKAENVSELKSVKRNKMERRPEQPQTKQLPWRQALGAKLNILPSWIDALEMSVANDWQIPRVGALIDLRAGDALRSAERTGLEWLIYSILKSGAPIPLYFIWGPIPRTISISYAAPKYIQHLSLVPDSRQIDELVKLPGDVAFSPLTLNEGGFQPVRSPAAFVYPRAASKALHDRGFQPARFSAGPVPPHAAAEADFFTGEDIPLDLPLDDHEDTLLEFPPVHPTSGQRRGERMEDYFVRREQGNARKLAKETPQDKAAHMQRADNAKRGRAPGKKGARVYLWTKEETDNGFYIRRPGGRNSYESLFDDYPPSQRRYDSFQDEWDLCSAFGDDGEDGPSDHDNDFGDDDDDYYGYLEANTDTPVVNDVNDALPLVDVRPASERALQRIYLDFGPDSGEGAQDGRPIYQPIAGDLTTALYKRFGFLMGQSQRTPSRVPEMSVVANLVGQQDIGANFVDVMATFFGQCLQAKSSDDLDQALFDLHHQDRSPLFKPWPFGIRRENLTNILDKSTNVYYVLCDNDSGLGSETLLIEHAADVVEIIRQGWGPRVKDVAKNLLMHGIPF
ncbi:hypothetical protein C8R45DRAFT_1103592 [Mycena sanguinolenta]|nr:hypothetical protein C8R45DRAFT_1103592 [Mycena sanguinolenta]